MTTGKDPAGEEQPDIQHLHDGVALRDLIRTSPDIAQHDLRLFIPTLNDPLYNSRDWAESVAHFCARNARNHFHLLTEDMKTCRHNTILVNYMKKVSDHVGLRQVAEEHRGLRELLLIIDDTIVLHQPGLDSLDSIVIRHYRPRIKDFHDRFNRMWQRATPQTLSTLGL